MLSSMNRDIPSWACLLDTRPLAGPVDRAAAKVYREQLSAQGISRGRPASLKNYLLGGFLAFFLINLAMVIDALWGVADMHLPGRRGGAGHGPAVPIGEPGP